MTLKFFTILGDFQYQEEDRVKMRAVRCDVLAETEEQAVKIVKGTTIARKLPLVNLRVVWSFMDIGPPRVYQWHGLGDPFVQSRLERLQGK